MRSRSTVLALLTLCGSVAPEGAAQTTVPLEPYLEVLRTTPVIIGRDTFDFILDTGGGVTLISPAVADRIGCHPAGRATGFRMRGEKVASPTCVDVPLQISGAHVSVDASVFDLMSLIGPDHPTVDGMISLRTFAGRPVTLDLPGNALILESPRSLARRVRAMTSLQARLANGQAGDNLDLFVGVPAGPRTLWLLWDSGHIGPVFLAPHALRLLGIADTTGPGTFPLPLAARVAPLASYRPVDIIYDGVIGDEVIRRTTWTVDLATGRAWVGNFAP